VAAIGSQQLRAGRLGVRDVMPEKFTFEAMLEALWRLRRQS
jgi:hypothetical protein